MLIDDDEMTPFTGIPGVDPVSLGVFNAFFRAARIQRQLSFRALGEKGLYPGQAGCLWIVHHHEGIAQSELADMLHVARPTITVMLQKMEKAGLIRRQVDDADQRLTRIYLTEEGRALHAHMDEAIADLINSSIGKLPEHEQLELERLLNHFCSALSSQL